MTADSLIEKLEAIKSQSGHPSAHNRAVDKCISIIRQHNAEEGNPYESQKQAYQAGYANAKANHTPALGIFKEYALKQIISDYYTSGAIYAMVAGILQDYTAIAAMGEVPHQNGIEAKSAEACSTASPASADYPECSKDPKCCPENEGYGCCGKFKGDASARKDEDGIATIATVSAVTEPRTTSPDSSREIPVVKDEEQLVADIAADISDTVSRLNGLAYTPQQWMGTARNALKHFSYHTKPEPVSVSLEKVTHATMIAEGRGHEIDDIDHVNNWRREAKAVLDAAGVKYVD